MAMCWYIDWECVEWVFLLVITYHPQGVDAFLEREDLRYYHGDFVH